MPTNQEEMGGLENLFRNFTRNIQELRGLDYLAKLQNLSVYSQERRLERYRIVYVWKIFRGIVPNCGLEFIGKDTRRGIKVMIPNLNKKSKRDQTIQFHSKEFKEYAFAVCDKQLY